MRPIENPLKVNEALYYMLTGDNGAELAGCTGYVSDAIAEIADGAVSIYTSDQIDYARENPESARRAVSEGLALDGREYFEANPNDDFEDYTAHVGVAAWYLDASNELYEFLGESLEYVALSHLRDVFGDVIDGDAWEHVKAMRTEDDDLDDVREEAERLYREYLDDSEALEPAA